MKILVAESERPLADQLVRHLTDEAYAVDAAYDGDRASELAEINPYDLIVLDQRIPGSTGLELLDQWRQAGLQIPIFMLARGNRAEELAQILDQGADDCLSRPFHLHEFLARVRCLLRRASKRPEIATLKADDLEMDRPKRQVEVADRPVPLSPKEFALLEYLLQHKDQSVTRGEIEEHVWDSSFDSFSNVVNVIIYRLRKKIDGDRSRKLLHTLPGRGYVLYSERR